ncbi:myristylprotein of the poxvirus entry/fusion-complex [Equine molluscum contagiosum-like virus]|nr:myristylprotein of the poxvirus entry/fusion-complex [Equine molluscum contagiosum-like virus]
MGSSVSLPTREVPPQQLTAEMRLHLMDMLGLLPEVPLGELLRIGPLITEEPRLTQIRNFLHEMLPEFDLVQTGKGLFGLRRHRHLGDLGRCCTSRGLRAYWEDTRTGEVFPEYGEGRSLRTCEPGARDKTGSLCDPVLFGWCDGPQADAELCRRWLGGVFTRHEVAPPGGVTSADAIIVQYARRCAQDVQTPQCEAWLHAMRVANEARYDRIIDAVLAQQSPAFRSEHMKCSYPTRRTLELSRHVLEPRECWDPNCVRGNVNFLLSENYHALARCHIYRCNVSIGTLVMDARSKLRVSCHDPSRLVDLNKMRVVEENLKRSFPLRTPLLAALALLLVWLLIVAL